MSALATTYLSILDAVLKRWPLIAFLTAAAMLAIAHAFQTFGHLAPCHLCLKQREVYWAALPVAAVGAVLLASPWRGPGRRWAGAALAVVFAYGAYLAGFQAGAEWGYWPAPQTCSSTGPVSLQSLQAFTRGVATAAPACDKAAWVFLGLSMAGWNFLVSLKLTVLSTLSILRPRFRP